MGAPKIWYGIPGKYNVKFCEALKNSFGDLFGKQHELHSRLVSSFAMA